MPSISKLELIIDSMPLAYIDLGLRGPVKMVLLSKRVNHPLKDNGLYMVTVF